ncbi:MAG: hypothetical protein PHO10_12180, partial [Gemmiger sp.]|nr:hypothetical protein [Gemmiger sp.]
MRIAFHKICQRPGGWGRVGRGLAAGLLLGLAGGLAGCGAVAQLPDDGAAIPAGAGMATTAATPEGAQMAMGGQTAESAQTGADLLSSLAGGAQTTTDTGAYLIAQMLCDALYREVYA